MSESDDEKVLDVILKLFDKPVLLTCGCGTVLLISGLSPSFRMMLDQLSLFKPLFATSIFGVFSWPVKAGLDSRFVLRRKIARIEKLHRDNLIEDSQLDFHKQKLVNQYMNKISFDNSPKKSANDDDSVLKEKIGTLVADSNPRTPELEQPRAPNFKTDERQKTKR